MASHWMPVLYNSLSMEEFCSETAPGGWNFHILFDEFVRHISVTFYARFFYSCLISHMAELCMIRDSLYELNFSNFLSSPLLFFRQTLGILISICIWGPEGRAYEKRLLLECGDVQTGTYLLTFWKNAHLPHSEYKGRCFHILNTETARSSARS
jgi:hypothetical protein